MSARLLRSVANVIVLILLLAACQPIQPIQPAAAGGESAATPALKETNFVVPVVTGEIHPGEVVTGTLESASSAGFVRHYWHFTGEAGRRYETTISPLDRHNDIVGNVVDASGSSVIYGEHDLLGVAQPELMPFTLKDGNDYYLVVRSLFDDPGPYKIELKMIAR